MFRRRLDHRADGADNTNACLDQRRRQNALSCSSELERAVLDSLDKQDISENQAGAH